MGFKIRCQVGEWGYVFQNYHFHIFLNLAKSKVFQTHRRQQAFFSKFDVKFGSWGIQALTQHPLRGLGQFTHEARSAEFTGGWVGWMGRGIKSVLQFSLYFVGI